MTTRRFKNKKTVFGSLLIMAICFCFMFGVLVSGTPAYAYVEQQNTWSNLNFSSNGNLSSVATSPTGWTKGISDSKATSGAINLDNYNDTFYLGSSDDLPSKLSDSADEYVLMINAKSNTNKSDMANAVQYYTNSSSMSLDAYSSYKVIVWMKVLENANGSIYITGLDQTIGFERINYSVANNWKTFTFYITTGKNTENIKTELYLGSKDKNTSTGAVFFDNIQAYKVSNSETPANATNEDKLVSTPTNSSDDYKYINLDERELAFNNANFENDDLSSFEKVVPAMKADTFRGVFDLSNEATSSANGITYLGTDLTKNNKKALVLYAKKDVTSYFGYKSPTINLPMFEIAKVTLNVKASLVNGSAYVTLKENDVINANGDVIEEIETKSESISISSTQTNKFLNDYTTFTFFVKGRSLYNTSFNLEFTLGNSDEEASGVVAFDNVYIEYISSSEYSSATTGSYAKKIDLQETTNTFGITNSTFNTVEKADSELKYPLNPSNWTRNVGEERYTFYGVINTNDASFNSHKAEFGLNANPGNPSGFKDTATDTNNILMMYNFRATYQSAVSSNFDVSSNSYYKLSFAYKLIASSSNKNILNVYLSDENNNVIYADEKIASNGGGWEQYDLYVSTNSYTNKLKLTLSLGTQDDEVVGQAFFDNVKIVKDDNMTKEAYNELVNNAKVLSFDEGNFNLIKDNGSNVYTALRYNGSLVNGTNPEFGMPIAEGGIVKALTQDEFNDEDNVSEFKVTASPDNEDNLGYLLMIRTFDTAYYTMAASDSITLSLDNYYKFTVYIKTQFTGTSEEEFGAEFSLTGIEENNKKTGIVAEDWTKYVIYVNCTTDTSVNVTFGLLSADANTTGVVYFDNFSYEKVDADEYNLAHLNNADDETYFFIGNTDAKIDENDEKTFNATALWYAIPTALLAFALIFAIIVYVMKKFKIKKWEKKKVNEYDREKTVHRNVIRAEAEKRRNEQVKKLQDEIREYEKEIEKIDEVRSKQMEARRGERAKGVTLNLEREFRQFAKRRTAIENRILLLNAEIENMNTAEYLLSVQHKIAVEKAKTERLAKEQAFKKDKKKK